MENQTGRTYEPQTPVVAGRPAYVGATPGVGVNVDENVMTARNRVQWGPIIAGLVTGIAVLIVLTVLGLAVGSSAFEPGKTSGLGTAAGIWGAVSAIIAFFLGGWVAAKTAAVGGRGSGMINGFVVGATALALILYLTTSGVGNLLGTVGNNIGSIANVVQNQQAANGTTPAQGQQQVQGQAQTAADQAATIATQNYNKAKDAAWGTFIGIVLALAAATIGGMLGYNQRHDLVEGTGPA